jgi:hypothetical protein
MGKITYGELFSLRKYCSDLNSFLPDWFDRRNERYGDKPYKYGMSHAHFSLLGLTKDGVRRWTELAKKHKLVFRGTSGYEYSGPSQSKNPSKRIKAFVKAKAAGKVPSSKRSETSRKRRVKQRDMLRLRYKREHLRLKVDEPLELRPTVSARHLRAKWRRDAPNVPWTEWRAKQEIKPVLCVTLGRRPVPVSAPVVEAIQRIYSRTAVEMLEYKYPNVRKPANRLVKWEPVVPQVAYVSVDRYRVPQRRTFNTPIQEVGYVLDFGQAGIYHRKVGGCTYVGSPPRDSTKYWYFLRKNGKFHLSEHHPLAGDGIYFREVERGSNQYSDHHG